MATEGWKFILFSAVFYLFLGMLILYNAGDILTIDVETPYCSESNYSSNWVYYTNINDSTLQNLPYGTKISVCLDCTNYSINFIDSNYYLTIIGKHNATWFSGVQYDVSGIGVYSLEPFNETIPYNDIRWVFNSSVITTVSQNCTTYDSVNELNYVEYILQNPFSSIGWLAWLSIAILITDLFIILYGLIP